VAHGKSPHAYSGADGSIVIAVYPRSEVVGSYAILVIYFIAFLGFSVFAFSHNYANLAFGVDGAASFLQAMHGWKWAPADLGFGPDPFEGLSDVWSGENAYLVPAHALYKLIFGPPSEFVPCYPITAYTIFASETFLATLALARSLGMSWSVGAIAAWILPLLVYPYFVYPLLFPISMIAPSVVGTTVSEATLLLALIARLGRGWRHGTRGRLRRDLPCALAIVGLLVVLIAAYPLRTILLGPAVVVLAIGLVMGADAEERLPKFVIGLTCALIVLALGAAPFVFGMFSYTTPRFWSESLRNTINDRSMISIWYGIPSVGPAGPKFFIFGMFGFVTAIAFGGRLLRACGTGILLIVAAIFLLGYIALTWQSWRGPMSLYFEFPLWPFYAVFGTWASAYWISRIIRAVARLATLSGPALRISLLPSLEQAATIIILSVAVALPALAFGRALSVDNRQRLYRFPPASSPMIQYLHDQIGLSPGTVFRGRVTNMEYVGDPKAHDWIDLAADPLDPRYLKSGNDYYSTGLWYYDVPTLFEYNAATSPALFRTLAYLLAEPADPQIRNVVVLRRPDAHALAILGVRFVIVSGGLPPPFRLVMTEHSYGDENLSLYEVQEVNLGTDTPTDAVLATGFDDALEKIAKPDFDPKRSVVVFDRSVPSGKLIPATSASVRVDRGGLTVEASSDGATLLVLPFEFSRCLQVETVKPDAEKPRLVRVNAIETGVIFNKKLAAKIEYFAGLFRNSFCRINDTREFSELLGKR
jgi:hypothetical protein